MSKTATGYEHVILNRSGVPIIAGTKTKVVELVVEREAFGYSPEEMHFQHPYLSLGQIHSALAYYWDHKDELDRDIERRNRRIERFKREMKTPPIVEKIRARRAKQRSEEASREARE